MKCNRADSEAIAPLKRSVELAVNPEPIMRRDCVSGSGLPGSVLGKTEAIVGADGCGGGAEENDTIALSLKM